MSATFQSDYLRARGPEAVAGDRAAESAQSAVSWAAIFAGALTGIAATAILLAVGAGLGFSAMSPWSDSGASAGTLALMTVVWLIVVQWVASALGGYVTGRLRTKWVAVHDNEVFFRDTAHGLLSWALATVVGLLLVGSAASELVGAGGRAVGGLAQGAGQAVAASPISEYQVDSLLRPQQPGPQSGEPAQQSTAEVTRILGNAVTTGTMPPTDRTYLAQLVASRAGVPPEEAQRRVDAAVEQGKQAVVRVQQAADTARKAAAKLALFSALAMLIGAFVASAAAAFGGRLRDDPY